MSRSLSPSAISPLRCLVIMLIVIAVSCLILSLPISVAASALADNAPGSSNELLHTFKAAREARLKTQPGPIDININININNNNNDDEEQHTNDNNQNTAIVFPAETSNAMWEFQTTPSPPQPPTGQTEEQLSLMAQNEDVDSRRTPFQDLIQQLHA